MKKTQLNFLCSASLIIVGCFTSYSQQAEKTTKPIRLTLKDTSPPSILLSYKANGSLNAQGKIDVVIIVKDISGIHSVAINSEVQPVSGNDSLVFAKAFVGDQEVSVLAKDKFNNVKERSFIIRGQAPQAPIAVNAPAIEHRNYLLLIAEQEYSDPAISHLSEPIKDANRLRDVLLKKYTFDARYLTLLTNPTFEDIEIEFEKLSKTITTNDNLLIFYAGHGYFDEKTNVGYWLPSDAKETNRAKWFRNSALVENIGAINSKHTLLIADACFSGGIFKTRAPFNNASVDIANMLKRPSRKAMTSGSLTTVPDKSVFMKYLIKTLEENQNLYLPSEDLFDEIRIGMKNNSNTKPLYGEIKDVGDEGGNFIFISKEK